LIVANEAAMSMYRMGSEIIGWIAPPCTPKYLQQADKASRTQLIVANEAAMSIYRIAPMRRQL
jgi:hypothetical protein